jgi:hypothetical protein
MRIRGRTPASAAAVAVLAAGLAACSVSTAAPAPRPARQAAPNNTMSGHVSVCVRPLRRRIAAYTFDGRRARFTVNSGREPRCLGHQLRILRIQSLDIGGHATFVRRGGCDRPKRGSRCVPQPTAHVRAADLAAVPLDPSYRNGNGAPARGCTRAMRNNPAAVGRDLERMYYKRPSDVPGRSVAGARWSNYGNPGRRFGAASMNYLLWNLPRTRAGVLPGGGIVEAALAQGQRLAVCDVAQLELPSFDRRGRRNGAVRFAYAKVVAGNETVYGWVMRGYRPTGHRFTRTLRSAVA